MRSKAGMVIKQRYVDLRFAQVAALSIWLGFASLGFAWLQPAFTAHHQKGVIVRLLIKREQRRLTARPRCLAFRGVTTQRGSSTPQLSRGNAAVSIRPAWDSTPPFHTAASCPVLHHTTHGTVSTGHAQHGRGPAANQLGQQPDQHRATPPLSGSPINPTQQTHL
jgi:hypothetical protein